MAFAVGQLNEFKLPSHSALLPTSHDLTTLIVKSAYERVLQKGVKENSGLSCEGEKPCQVSHTWSITWQRFDGVPYHPPLSPSTSAHLRSEGRTSILIHSSAGPLHMHGGVEKSSKVSISMYTCCHVQAINLYLVPDMILQCSLSWSWDKYRKLWLLSAPRC